MVRRSCVSLPLLLSPLHVQVDMWMAVIWYVTNKFLLLPNHPSAHRPISSMLNRFRSGQLGRCAKLHKWRMESLNLCQCGDIRNFMNYIVESCAISVWWWPDPALLRRWRCSNMATESSQRKHSLTGNYHAPLKLIWTNGRQSGVPIPSRLRLWGVL